MPTESISHPDPGPEWAVLEAIARGDTSASDSGRFAQLLDSGSLDTAELVDQAMRHKMIFHLALFLETHGLEWRIPVGISHCLPLLLGANRYRTALLRNEAGRIATALRHQGVRFVFTKGIILESAVHGGEGGRAMSDVDLMIEPEERERVTGILEALGFRKGHYHRQRGTVELDRRSAILYELSPDHLPHFVRPLGDRVVPYISVDVANSLTWFDSPWEVPVGLCLERSRPYRLPGSDLPVPAPDPAIHFLFTALHLFREAWFDHAMRSNSDVNLTKFSDLHRCWAVWRQDIIDGGFLRLLDEYRLHEPVLWVLEHLDRTLGTGVCEALGLAGRVSEEWLHTARRGDGRYLHWRGTMRQRLISRNRESLLVGREKDDLFPLEGVSPP